MKRTISMLLLAALTATTICGCSQGGGNSSGQADSKPVETQATEKAETQATTGGGGKRGQHRK